MGLLMIAVGAGIGGLSAYYFVVHPMDFSAFTSGFKMFAVSSLIHFSLGWWHLVYSSLIMLTVVFISALFPALKAAGEKPVEAIHFV